MQQSESIYATSRPYWGTTVAKQQTSIPQRRNAHVSQTPLNKTQRPLNRFDFNLPKRMLEVETYGRLTHLMRLFRSYAQEKSMQTPKKSTYILIFLIVLYSCNIDGGHESIRFADNFKKEVDKIIASEKDSVIVINGLTGFQWDIMYVFGPYTYIEDINEKLGFEWENAESTNIHRADDYNLLVFVKDANVVAFSKVPRNFGDFYKLSTSGPYSKDDSDFVVEKGKFGKQNWIFLYK